MHPPISTPASTRASYGVWVTLAAAAILALCSNRVLSEWLAAWFSYGTYSAIFTYGAIGIPALGYLIWTKAPTLKPAHGSLPLLLGGLLLALGCGLALFSAQKDVRFAGVFVGVVGLVVLHWGPSAPRFLWQELGLLLLAIPFPIVFSLTHNSFFQAITAYGSAFMLWYVGVPAVSDGLHVRVVEQMSNGTFQVVSGVVIAESCSGTAIGFTLTYLGFLIPALLPVSFKRRLLLGVVGPLMAVFCNTMRAAFLVFVQRYVGAESFSFWHDGDGRLIYSFSTLMAYGIVALWIVGPALEVKPKSLAPVASAEPIAESARKL